MPNNQELILCAMISFILITLMFGPGVIMLGEIIYLSLLQVKVYNRIAMFETAYQIINISVYLLRLFYGKKQVMVGQSFKNFVIMTHQVYKKFSYKVNENTFKCGI